MKKILVTFDCNNGYQCSCCRQDWEEWDIYEVDDDADTKEFIDNLQSLLSDRYDYGRQEITSAYIVSEQIY